MNKPNFRSAICNTDCYGLRFNSSKYVISKKESVFDTCIDKKKSLFVGSSTTFGVGATSDEKTIPSILSGSSDYFFYNFGGRAFNGFQEIILTQLMINKIYSVKKILLLSGIPDIYMTYNINFNSSFPGPFFFNGSFIQVMNELNLGFKKRLLRLFFPNLDIENNNFTMKNLIYLLLNYKNVNNNKINSVFPKINLAQIVSRNINLWKSLSKSTDCELIFFFPPFISWSKSKNDYTKEEMEISTFIESIDDPNNSAAYKEIEKDYVKIVKLFEECCKNNKIKFYDCNSVFQSDENKRKWLFVDKVHLTDCGNKIISDYILSKI
jgi:hypothetical protein